MVVVVKGTPIEVYPILDGRMVFNALITAHVNGQCIVRCADDNKERIALWFREWSESFQGTGYPVGTCLFYR